MDRQAPLRAPSYRVEHHTAELAPFILRLSHQERTARTVAALVAARYRVQGTPGWIVVIHQAEGRDEEVLRLLLQRDFLPNDET